MTFFKSFFLKVGITDSVVINFKIRDVVFNGTNPTSLFLQSRYNKFNKCSLTDILFTNDQNYRNIFRQRLFTFFSVLAYNFMI